MSPNNIYPDVAGIVFVEKICNGVGATLPKYYVARRLCLLDKYVTKKLYLGQCTVVRDRGDCIWSWIGKYVTIIFWIVY